MKRVAIVPQQIKVAAPPTLVLDVLGAMSYACRPNTGRRVERAGASKAGPTTAFIGPTDQQGNHILKQIVVQPPDEVISTHVGGPFADATERMYLHPTGRSTQIELTADLDVPQGATARMIKLLFEHEIQQQLLDLKHAIEERALPRMPEGIPVGLVDVPPMSTEDELLAAVEAQEEAEWGHAGHGRGVARIAVSLAEDALLNAREIDEIRRAALLHDVGKIALDSRLWGLRGTLTPEQRTLMTAHARLGHDFAGDVDLPEAILSAILYHHERWDGLGYPEQLAGDVIPIGARIIGLAENIDSMLRPTYRRQSLSIDQVCALLQDGAGRQWDPKLTRRAIRIIRGQ